MTPPLLPLDTDDAFEAEVRAMLARRAHDVTPAPLPADEVSDGTPTVVTLDPAAPPRRLTTRRLVAAAAAVVVLAVSVGAVLRSGDRPDAAEVPAADSPPAPGTRPETPDGDAPSDDGPAVPVPVPGGAGWDPATALPVWPLVGVDDPAALGDDPNAGAGDLAAPDAAATAYLAEVAGALHVDPATPSVDGRLATVGWRGPAGGDDAGALPTGTVFLRDVGDAATPLWVVVGAATDAFALDGVSLADGWVAFAVVPRPEHTESVSVRLGDGSGGYLPVGGEPLPQPDATPADDEVDPSLGEIVRGDPGQPVEVSAPLPAGTPVDLLARSIGGDFLSVAHVAFVTPG